MNAIFQWKYETRDDEKYGNATQFEDIAIHLSNRVICCIYKRTPIIWRLLILCLNKSASMETLGTRRKRRHMQRCHWKFPRMFVIQEFRWPVFIITSVIFPSNWYFFYLKSTIASTIFQYESGKSESCHSTFLVQKKKISQSDFPVNHFYSLKNVAIKVELKEDQLLRLLQW